MKRKKIFRSDFLFPKTNLIIGAGSVLNLAGEYFLINYSNSDIEADNKAIESDWGKIGDDIKEVIKNDNKITSLTDIEIINE